MGTRNDGSGADEPAPRYRFRHEPRCRVVSGAGGNPFLVGELLAELDRERVVPSADAIPIVRSVGPKGVARSVLVRIAAVGPQAVQLARGVAVLGEDTRLRRAAISGPASVTPSERRIAEQAAAGKTNRQIAQELFLTMRTVAFHLTNAYRKLELSSREELAAALSDPD